MSDKKILVAYGTRYGSARITAEEIAAYLVEKGNNVTLVNLRKEKIPGSLKEYDLIAAGSSIAMFMWIGKVKRFLGRCKKSGVPTGVWINCGMAIDKQDEARERFLDKVINKISLNPVATGIIGPALDFTPGTGLPEGLKKRIKGTIKSMAKEKYREDGLMDLRDPDAVKTFADSLG